MHKSRGVNKCRGASIFVLFLVLSISLTLDASTTGKLSGVVRDSSGKALQNVMVKIRNLEKAITVTVFTDEEGKYWAANFFPGLHEVAASLPGHTDSVKREIDVKPDQQATLDLVVDPEKARPWILYADWVPLLPEGENHIKYRVTNGCVNCHGADTIMRMRLTALDWKKVILDMGRRVSNATIEIRRPAWWEITDEEAEKVTGAQIEDFSEYFAKHFGPESTYFGQRPEPRTYGGYRSDVRLSNFVITQYDIPTANATPHNIVADSKGRIWFVERFSSKIGMLNPKTAEFKEYNIPTPSSLPHGIDVDQEGIVWFTESLGDNLGRLDPATGMIREYPVPKPGGNSSLHSIAIGKDGRVWFADIGGSRVGGFHAETEELKMYDSPSAPNALTYGIAVDSQNRVWFTEFGAGKLVMLDPKDGKMQAYDPPTPHSGPRRLRIDKEGNVWFTEYAGNKIARFEPDTEKFTEWEIPTKDSGPYEILIKDNGEIWLTLAMSNMFAKFDPRTGKFWEIPLPTYDAHIRKLTVDAEGTVWGAEYGTSKITKIVERADPK